MKFSDAFAMGGRSLKERPLETGLIILGIALSACVASASMLLLGSQRAETARLLQGPAYREIVIQAESGNGPDSASALREIVQGTNDRINFSQSDIDSVLAATATIRYSYKASTDNMRVNGFGGPGGFGGPPGNQASTSPASSASPNASASPAVSAAPDRGPPGGPESNLPQATLADNESLIKPALTEFRNMQVSPEFFQAYGLEADEGSLFTDSDSQNQSAVLILGRNLAAQLFPDQDIKTLVGHKVRLENRIYAISGLLSPPAEKVVTANGTSLASLAFTPVVEMVIKDGNQTIRFSRGNSTLRFAVGNSANLSEASTIMTSYFEKAYGVGKVRISVPFEEARLSRDGFDRLLWVIVAFGVGALLMALINLMNMMLTRALRRQAIMGIMGAMGASQKDLLKMQAIEGSLMSTLGSLLGIAGSLPFYNVLYSAGKNLFGIAGGQAPLDLVALLITAPAILVLGLILALIPAWQSSSVPITVALRSE